MSCRQIKSQASTTYCESQICRFSACFEDNCSRLCFVRRVFLLLIVSLMLMFVQILLVELVDDVKNLFAEYYWIAFIGLTLFLSVCMICSCSPIARSCFPWNFIIFIFLIESLTLILMVVAAKFSGTVILMSLLCESIILLLLLILALTVPIDFTKWTVLFVMLFLVIFTYAIAIIVSTALLNIQVEQIAYSLIAAIVLSVTFLLNLQVLFNGDIFELCPDDFIQGAILMYADIIMLLMCCLKLIGFDTDH